MSSSPHSATACAADASVSPPQIPVDKKRTIRLISYNISMAQPSAQAPSHWTRSGGGGASSSSSSNDHGQRFEHASDLISAILGPGSSDNAPRASTCTANASSSTSNNNLTEVELFLRHEILRNQPDIIALQECPTRNWSTRVICTHAKNQYVSVGTAPSHCGYVDLLVRRDWTWERIATVAPGGPGAIPLPSVAAMVEIPLLEDDVSSWPSSSSLIAKLAISSSHLAPHRENASVRFGQLQRLVCQMEQHKCNAGCEATDLILLGDMNMRKDEDGRVERIGWVPPSASKSGSNNNTCANTSRSGNHSNSGCLLDAWKVAGSDPATRDTWNSYVNCYHGADGFEFRCRFDRTYYRPAAAAEVGVGPSLRLVSFGLVGNRPILREQGGGGPSHFLSDHFGMLVTFEVARSDDICNDDDDDDGDGDGDGDGAPGSETQPSKKKTKL